jgi:HD-like signal output (HDOD) protein
MAHVLPLIGFSVDALPVLPEVAQRVLASIHDPVADMHDVAGLLAGDAVLGARVMQLANSVAYGGTSRISALPEACARLGMKRIAHVVHLTAQVDAYRMLGPRYREFLGRLWRHSVAAAQCVDMVAAGARLRLEESPFVAGLVHDIGKLVLADVVLNRYTGPIGQLQHSPERLMEAIEEYHTLAGLHAIQKWGLPSAVAVAVYFQSRPLSAPNGDGKTLALAVGLADAMATAAGFGLQDDHKADLANHPAIAAFELDLSTLAAYCDGLPELLEPVLESFTFS